MSKKEAELWFKAVGLVLDEAVVARDRDAMDFYIEWSWWIFCDGEL